MSLSLKNVYAWLICSFICFTLTSACSGLGPRVGDNATATVSLPGPEVYVTRVPDVRTNLQRFFQAWKEFDYPSMYRLIASPSQAQISEESFVQQYEQFAGEAALQEIAFEILEVQQKAQESEARIRVQYQSAIIGNFEREIAARIVLEDGAWRLIWDPTLIMPELVNGNYVRMDREIPTRRSIFDRFGNPLAAQTNSVAIGLWPDYVDLEDDGGLLGLLAKLTGIKAITLQGMIETAEPGAYLPIAEVPADRDVERLEILKTFGAVVTSEYTSRLYYGNGIAPHVVGYVSAIQKEELTEYLRKGYRSDEKVGRKGIELWGEEILGGTRGGTLYVFNAEGKYVAQIGAAPSRPGQDIYTTLDSALQVGAQKAMSVFNGAIVVMEVQTGRVLAMVSAPGFNPNAYQTENYNWSSWLDIILNDTNTPQFNRAAQGQYPLGSVFKLVTMAAALQSGRYIAETQYDCGYVWEELPGFPRYDWTYEHFQEDGVTRPSGVLNLKEGLIRSCNPFFWHIGLDLYNQGLHRAISDMARGFGLGSKTGIEVIDEEAGRVPDPQSQVEAINLAIGQGDLLVTPLQVARFVAAIANGGTLYRPQLIERIQGENGVVSYTFSPEVQGNLPVSPENLKIIQEAMLGVIRSQIPEGTAYRAFTGLDIPVAGKTGTATSSEFGEPHAWFVGYTFANREDKPDIAIVVIAENAGEGSEIAAPIFRRIVELYFFGAPRKLYRWEAAFDVTKSPTPILTETPTPQP